MNKYSKGPFIPEPLRERIFDIFHHISHPEPTPIAKLIKARNIRSWVKGCLQCQQHKISRHTRIETIAFSQLSRRFETVHVDIISHHYLRLCIHITS